MTCPLVPFENRVVVELYVPSKKGSLLIVPEGKAETVIGKVIKSDNSKLCEGEHVVFPSWIGTKINHLKKDYILLKLDEILCKITNLGDNETV